VAIWLRKRKKAYFLFVINPFTRSKKIYHIGRSWNICGTVHCIWIYQRITVLLFVYPRWWLAHSAGTAQLRIPHPSQPTTDSRLLQLGPTGLHSTSTVRCITIIGGQKTAHKDLSDTQTKVMSKSWMYFCRDLLMTNKVRVFYA